MAQKKTQKRSARVTATKKLGIAPLGDRVLIRPASDDATRTASGIYIPDTSKKEMPERGVVVAVGAGKRTEAGVVIPLSVRVGDAVLFSKYGFDEVSIDGTTYYLVSEGAILAVMN
jgi:chaperonin GroES